MHVIGTAGHVDHGKSSLVAALTGMHPDRLKEEISREMSIDLGFAWLEIPGQDAIGIVDVPGHRDFIENMLAGVGGIDTVLFVIAADEGVMPQTREHLAIIDLLQIQNGIIVLNKIDLVNDPEWLDMVELDIREIMQDTVLANAPVVRVSARTNQGIDDLKRAIQTAIAQKSAPPNLAHPRLPVDRVFTLPGFGAIVTGTLLDGCFQIGDEITILPAELQGRIRGLQTHKHKEEKACPGNRTAINISGVNKTQVKRGDIIAHPGDFTPTNLIDLHFRLLRYAHSSLKHNTEVKFFVGAAEVLAQCRVLGSDEIAPGEEGYIQLRLHDPVVSLRGDHYILRRPSPPETLGGGIVLDPHPMRIHKRYNASTLSKLDEMRKGKPSDIILQLVDRLQTPTIDELVNKSGLDTDDCTQSIQELIENNSLILLPDIHESGKHRAITKQTFEIESRKILELLTDYHQSKPLKVGMTRESLKAKIKNPGILFELIINHLASENIIVLSGTTIALTAHKITFSPDQEKQVKDFLARMGQNAYTPPSLKEGSEFLGEDVMQALIFQQELVRVSADVIFLPSAYQQMLNFVKSKLGINNTIALAELRDEFQTSRKYALAFLEHLDTIGVTVRQGDLRMLKNK